MLGWKNSEKKMVNKNYVKGRNKEYRVKNKYQDQDYICTRSAGSHGVWDVICVHPLKKKILFIQCKPENFSEKQKSRLYKGYQFLNDVFSCKFVVE